MDTVDATTWQAIGLTLTVVGLVVSVWVYRRRGAPAGLRAVAWSLLPLAAGLTGTLRLLWRIGDLTVQWAVHLVFNPLMWLGLAVLALSVLLFVVSGVLRRRGASPEVGERPAAAVPGRSRRGVGKPASGGKDLDEIEAILRKHGIS